MTCQKYQEDIGALIDGELSAERTSAVFRHVSACGECSSFFSTLLRFRGAIVKSPEIEVPKSLDRRVNAMPSTAVPVSRSVRFVPRWKFFKRNIFLPVPVAATLFVVIFICGIALSNFVRPQKIVAKTEFVYILELPQVEVREESASKSFNN